MLKQGSAGPSEMVHPINEELMSLRENRNRQVPDKIPQELKEDPVQLWRKGHVEAMMLNLICRMKKSA